MPNSANGILIAVDGIDGAGKTTQVKILVENLRAAGETVVSSKEPTDGPWGRLVRESAQNGRLDLDAELHAFVEDRKEHVASTILPALGRGEVVILDRYYYSTIAYQGARGANVEKLTQQMRALAPEPDAAFLIDLDSHTAIERIRRSRGDIPNEFERAESLEVVRKLFTRLAHADPRIRFVDGRLPIETVYATITQVLLDGVLKLKRCAKAYGCDVFYCSERMTGNCDWASMYGKMRGRQPNQYPAIIK
jgi:dTMP kinase